MRDERGRTVDVHALRHSFGTLLSKGGRDTSHGSSGHASQQHRFDDERLHRSEVARRTRGVGLAAVAQWEDARRLDRTGRPAGDWHGWPGHVGEPATPGLRWCKRHFAVCTSVCTRCWRTGAKPVVARPLGGCRRWPFHDTSHSRKSNENQKDRIIHWACEAKSKMFPGGLEPPTFGFGGRRSIQLSYENGWETSGELYGSTVSVSNVQ